MTTRVIACGAGFAGDRIDPAVTLAASQQVNAIGLECLAERTLVPGLRARRLDSAAGADPPTLEMIVASPARSVAYLSCDPRTLARDLAVLISSGFKLATVQAIDMMPQTRQVEALAFLRR